MYFCWHVADDDGARGSLATMMSSHMTSFTNDDDCRTWFVPDSRPTDLYTRLGRLSERSVVHSFVQRLPGTLQTAFGCLPWQVIFQPPLVVLCTLPSLYHLRPFPPKRNRHRRASFLLSPSYTPSVLYIFFYVLHMMVIIIDDGLYTRIQGDLLQCLAWLENDASFRLLLSGLRSEKVRAHLLLHLQQYLRRWVTTLTLYFYFWTVSHTRMIYHLLIY